MRYGDACQEKAKLVLPDDSKVIANMIQEANTVLDVSEKYLYLDKNTLKHRNNLRESIVEKLDFKNI